MSKQTNNKKAEPKAKKNINLKSATMGVMQLFVVASIAYSTAVIAMGTEGYVPLALVAPQALWAVCTLVKRFSK